LVVLASGAIEVSEHLAYAKRLLVVQSIREVTLEMFERIVRSPKEVVVRFGIDSLHHIHRSSLLIETSRADPGRDRVLPAQRGFRKTRT
jgi:hypothetical protein